MVRSDDDDPDGQPCGALYDHRRDQGHHMGRRATDGCNLRGADPRPLHGHPHDAAAGELLRCGDAGGRLWEIESSGYALRLEQPVQHLEWPDWWDVSGAGLLWM